MIRQYCNKCEFWLHNENGIGDTLKLHQKYSCDDFIKRLKITKSVLVNVYGKDWIKHWLGKIPTYLRDDRIL